MVEQSLDQQIKDFEEEVIRQGKATNDINLKRKLLSEAVGYFLFFNGSGAGMFLLGEYLDYFVNNPPNYMELMLYFIGGISFMAGFYIAGSIYKSMRKLDL